jgi:hypothetical protein
MLNRTSCVEAITLAVAALLAMANISAYGQARDPLTAPIQSQGSATSTAGANVFYITDPSLGMNAVSVTIPPKWHGQGVLYAAGACGRFPYYVFRASSSDGLSYVEALPAFSWSWGTGPAAIKNSKDCFAVRGPMGASDFQKYLAATMNLEYVSDEPVPEDQRAQVKKAQDDANALQSTNYLHTTSSMEPARAIVRSRNGTFVMKGLFETLVDCEFDTFPGMKSVLRGMPDQPNSYVHRCTATVRYTVAPEAQFAAVRKLWEPASIGGKLEQPWVQAWLMRNRQQAQQMMAQNIQQSNARMQAQQQQFNHDQAVRQQMHEQFLATMQRGTDMSMARAQQSMNARSTAASDWVDYALDQKTVADPNTGQITKVSSAYTHTWVDSSGKVSYQTNDSNADPNGVLPGNWTQQQTVHGNGTPQ